MKTFTLLLLAGMLSAMWPIQSAALPQGFTVDADLPAGNIIVDGIVGDAVKVRKDLRDSNMWFYWAFRVRGGGGAHGEVRLHGKDVGRSGRSHWLTSR